MDIVINHLKTSKLEVSAVVFAFMQFYLFHVSVIVLKLILSFLTNNSGVLNANKSCRCKLTGNHILFRYHKVSVVHSDY